jgi:hypothetical protein
LTLLCVEFEPLCAQLLARHPCFSLMDVLAEVHNEETHLPDAGFLWVSFVLAAHSSVARPAAPMPLVSPLIAPSAARGARLVFIAITVVEMDMWRPFAT